MVYQTAYRGETKYSLIYMDLSHNEPCKLQIT